MNKKKPWTKDECQFLEENWGVKSKKLICTHLNRSYHAVRLKAQRLKLGAFLENGEYVTLNQFFIAIGKTGSNGYADFSWIKNRGLPVKYKTVDTFRFKIIYIEAFWKWAQEHRNFINWTRFEKNAIGKEPDWVDAQRTLAVQTQCRYRKTPWTASEDSRLRAVLKQYKYTYDELSRLLMRTTGAIQHRCVALGLKERPIKVDGYRRWTEAEDGELRTLIKSGYNYELIAEKMGRSSKAIRGHVFAMYKTENIDKACKLIGDANEC